MAVRRPAVAGSFYPSDPQELSELIDSCYLGSLGPGRLPPASRGEPRTVACVVPHAGYVYSGGVASHSYLHVSSLPDPELVVVIGPNHYGVGSGASIWPGGDWSTPLGKVHVDDGAARDLSEEAGIIDLDTESHRMEHSVEVQVPFIQKLYGDRVPFVPISLAFQDIDTTRQVARGVVKVLKGRRGVLIASSDFSHYVPASEAARKDLRLVEDILSLDTESFYGTLDRLQVTACGFGAIATVMQASKGLGFKKAVLLKYATSGDTTGDNSQVVGYGALRFE